ncbi:putative inner membrane protein [Psychrobacter sp. JCM 18902]|nr:putative inner membrane protein [Psychrobacter sp. JCM 18902]
MGKSLSLKLAASVWGNPDRYVKTWRSTDNALEGTASEHNDSFLPLDEISECDPKIVGKTVYMLANGHGKGRSTTTGHNRKAKEWRIIFLSNGEESLQNFMAQAGQKTNAGIEVRVAHIDADAGKGLKTFDSLVLADTSEAQADKINELSHAYHGVAGIAWLEHITTDKTATTATAKQLISDFMSQYSDLKAQAHRVAKRFAIVSAAGELATSAGITGWQVGQATTAVMTCLDNWLDNYGRDGEHEQRQIIEHIKAFIEQHGSSRFQPCYKNTRLNFEERTPNRIGYRNMDTGDYYFSKETFDSVCAPFSKKKVLQVLEEADLLLLNQGDRKIYKTPDTLFNGKHRPSVYAVTANILSCEPMKRTGQTGGTGQAICIKGFRCPTARNHNGSNGTGFYILAFLSRLSHC